MHEWIGDRRNTGGGRFPPQGPRFPAKPADLDIDFSIPDRVRLASMVVANSLGIETADVLGWNLNRRVGALAAIASVTFGDVLTWQVPCPSPACGQSMELELRLEPFLSALGSAETFEYRPAPGSCLTVRLPTGLDQQTWSTLTGPPQERFLAMASRLVESLNGSLPAAGWQLPAEWLDGVEEQLSARDPFTISEADLECPSCGSRHTRELDIEKVILARFSQEQRRSMEDVHRLASVYHWSEAEVLALPPSRRTFYLHRAEAER